MKHIILLTLLSLSSVFAQLPSKVDDLKAKRDKAIENINQIYKQELQKLLNDPSISIYERAEVELEFRVPNINSPFSSGWKSAIGTEYTFNENKTGSINKNNTLTTFKWIKKTESLCLTQLLFIILSIKTLACFSEFVLIKLLKNCFRF